MTVCPKGTMPYDCMPKGDMPFDWMPIYCPAYNSYIEFNRIYNFQEYLFENGRIDNIFTDNYYDAFTTALHEVIKNFKLPTNELGYFVTRIEEEHLWEAKQLGAHSPQVRKDIRF